MQNLHKGGGKMRELNWLGTGAALLVASCMLAEAAVAEGGAATGETSGKGIALATYSAANTWHQQMIKTVRGAMSEAEENKLIAKGRVVEAQGSAPQQAALISNLIIEGWDAIILDAASPTALNGTLKQACNAGITVVVFDSLVTEPCVYKVSVDFGSLGRQVAAHAAEKIGGKGNVLEIRGMAGTGADDEIHNGVMEELAKYPDIKVVGSVYGNWTQTVSQKEVGAILPTLPEIDAVVTQGGDAWGAYQAFKDAGRKIPMIIMGNRKDELKLWDELNNEPGNYDTVSMASAPGIGSVAFWIAQQILAGKEVPKTISMPFLVIDNDSLAGWLAATPDGGVATPIYSQDWTVNLIDASIAGEAVPAPTPPAQN
jgi:ribose transport system substrate-binding protein